MIASIAQKLVRIFVVAATIGVLGLSSEAKATFSITISGGVDSITITDGGTGDNDFSLNGSISFLTIQSSFLSTGTATASSGLGGASLGLSSFLYNNSTLSPQSNATVTLANTALTAPVGAFALTSNLVVASGALGITYSEVSSITNLLATTPPANVLFGTTPSSVSTSIGASPTSSYDFSATYTASNVANGSNFALNGSSSTLTPAAAAPAPLTAVAVGLALPMFGLFGAARRRMIRKA